MLKVQRLIFSLIPIFIIVSYVSLAKLAQAAILTIPNANQKGITVQSPEETFTISPEQITSWQGQYFLPAPINDFITPLNLNDLMTAYLGRQAISEQKYISYNYAPREIYLWVKSLSPEIDLAPAEPKLNIINGRVTDFQPPQNGQKLDAYSSTQAIMSALAQNLKTAALIVDQTTSVTSLSTLNNLGITELLARGQSNFKGSPKNRRFNIKVGVEKMKGIIVKSGDEFSFNKYLGSVEASTGFLPELVIKQTGTVPEFGGGLCQVSSTTFRAAVLAGLPITARKNHSYAVQYYAPQGTDATIYPGAADLKFTNNTPGSILVWPYVKGEDTLIFDFYGTKDNRQVDISPPVQYDFKPDGSLKATWTRKVTKDGVTATDVFKSVYLSPALFHKQEIYVPTTPETPPSNPTPNNPNQPNGPNQAPPTNINQL